VSVGEVRWVEFPARGGRAQAGRRPAIVVQDISALPTVLVVPLTSQFDALRFPGTVLIEADPLNGLRHTSVALVFQLTAIDHRYIHARLEISRTA
jgi:mRNA-degrading endonuclease toxin of MazEF toxin-antitoxin module